MMGGFPEKTGHLCWECRRACVDMCSWAEELKPVDGWTADRVDVNVSHGSHYGDKADESYIVRDCPLFSPGKIGGRASDLDTKGCIDLLAAATELARKDYIRDPDPKHREMIEWWFDGHPEGIARMKAEAEKADAKGRRDRNDGHEVREWDDGGCAL